MSFTRIAVHFVNIENNINYKKQLKSSRVWHKFQVFCLIQHNLHLTCYHNAMIISQIEENSKQRAKYFFVFKLSTKRKRLQLNKIKTNYTAL